jgi:hypothetical protein
MKVMATAVIRSIWTTEKASWDRRKNDYGPSTFDEEKKYISCKLVLRGTRLLVEFAGPTGYETYDLETMYKVCDELDVAFCVCAGTVNSWPRCQVNMEDVKKFMRENTDWSPKDA